MKKLSIITPVFNVDKWLYDTITSICLQNYLDFELLLIDDGSPDNSANISDNCAYNDYRIVVIHKLNNGVSSARNVGIDLACGKYIGFVDSDDLIEKIMFEKMIDTLEVNYADIVQCRHDRGEYPSRARGYFDKKIVSGKDFVDILSNLKGADYTNQVALWSKVYVACLWKKSQFPVGRDYEDEQETYKTCLRANKIVFLPDVLYHYIKRDDSIITGISPKKMKDKQLALLDKFVFLNSNLPHLSQKTAQSFFNYSFDVMCRLYKSNYNDMKEVCKLILDNRKKLYSFLNNYQKFLLFCFNVSFLRDFIIQKQLKVL